MKIWRHAPCVWASHNLTTRIKLCGIVYWLDILLLSPDWGCVCLPRASHDRSHGFRNSPKMIKGRSRDYKCQSSSQWALYSKRFQTRRRYIYLYTVPVGFLHCVQTVRCLFKPIAQPIPESWSPSDGDGSQKEPNTRLGKLKYFLTLCLRPSPTLSHIMVSFQ